MQNGIKIFSIRSNLLLRFVANYKAKEKVSKSLNRFRSKNMEERLSVSSELGWMRSKYSITII